MWGCTAAILIYAWVDNIPLESWLHIRETVTRSMNRTVGEFSISNYRRRGVNTDVFISTNWQLLLSFRLPSDLVASYGTVTLAVAVPHVHWPHLRRKIEPSTLHKNQGTHQQESTRQPAVGSWSPQPPSALVSPIRPNVSDYQARFGEEASVRPRRSSVW
jgi:hypothetical protein